MSAYKGDFPVNHTAVVLEFDSFAAATGAPTATSNFAAADVQVYKNGSATQRSSANGITVSTSFDSQTGLQQITIDLSDNTDAGFYIAGSEIQVAIADVTVDGQTVRFWVGSFSIERAGGVLALLKAGTAKVDVTKWLTGTIPSPNVTGIPLIDAKYLLGTIFSTPTVAGILNTNVKTINDVATTPVTTVKAVQGLTTADTITTYTGNTKQTGDVFAALPTNFSAFVIDASGRINAFLVGILTSVFTEGATGRVAAAFKQFFNIATPAATMDHGVLVDTVSTLTNAPSDSSGVTTLLSRLSSARAGYLDLLNTYLDAAISSRSTYAGADTSGTTTLLSRLSSARAGYLDLLNTYIDAAISSRSTYAGGDTSGTTTLLARLTSLRAGYLDNLGGGAVALNSDLQALITTVGVAGAGLTAADDATLAAIAALHNIAAGAAMTLTSGERDAIAAALLDLVNAIETGLTVRQALRVATAALAGEISGAETTSVVIRNTADTKDRVTATVDAYGNRSAVTLDVS